MSEITFGPSGGGRPVSRFVRIFLPFNVLIAGFGLWQVLSGTTDSVWRVVTWALLGVGVAGLMLGAAIMMIESRQANGRTVGPEGIWGRGGALAWPEVSRVSLHRGAGGHELLAVWPNGSDTPIWLGALDRASVHRDEALRQIAQWSGREVEQA